MTVMRAVTTFGLLGIWGLVPAGLAFTGAAAADDSARVVVLTDFGHERPSREARHVARWVVHAGDNHNGDRRLLPFVIVDKQHARLFVFEADGRLRGAAPALLGAGIGDTAPAGIGNRALSSIAPRERTTPAGRFLSALGVGARNEDVLWVDYEGAVAIHRVITTNPKERRLQRLASATPRDNRISYGCINVPANFYDEVLRPAFAGTYGIVYVLPETSSAQKVFASYEVEGQVDDGQNAATSSSMKAFAGKRNSKEAVK